MSKHNLFYDSRDIGYPYNMYILEFYYIATRIGSIVCEIAVNEIHVYVFAAHFLYFPLNIIQQCTH